MVSQIQAPMEALWRGQIQEFEGWANKLCSRLSLGMPIFPKTLIVFAVPKQMLKSICEVNKLIWESENTNRRPTHLPRT